MKKDIKFSKGGHEFVFFEMWDERPHTQYQLSMIRFYLPLNQLILWPSESQTCQNWAQLLKGSLSTNFTYLGEIISIFVYIFRFCWESWLISTFDLHFGLHQLYIFWNENVIIVPFYNKFYTYMDLHRWLYTQNFILNHRGHPRPLEAALEAESLLQPQIWLWMVLWVFFPNNSSFFYA